MKLFIKRGIGLLMAVAIILSCTIPALAAVRTYEDQFTDVSATEWYYSYVKEAYEIGLIDGVSETSFNPEGTLTIAQAIKLAACIHMINGSGIAEFETSQPWYQVYVDYCVENNIIGAADYEDVDVPATRAQFAVILAASLPASSLAEMNTVNDGDIPDVSMSGNSYGTSVYRLYRAGILTGSDTIGTFNASTSIRRSEVSAIVVRMTNPDTRVSINISKSVSEPEPEPEPEPEISEATLYIGTFGRTADSFTLHTMPYTGELTPEMLIEGIEAATKIKLLLYDDVEVEVKGGYVYINVTFSSKSEIFSRADNEELEDTKTRIFTALDSIKKTLQMQYVSQANDIEGRVKVYYSVDKEDTFEIEDIGLDMETSTEWPGGVRADLDESASTQGKELTLLNKATLAILSLSTEDCEVTYEGTETISSTSYSVYTVVSPKSWSSINGQYAVNLDKKTVYYRESSSKTFKSFYGG